MENMLVAIYDLLIACSVTFLFLYRVHVGECILRPSTSLHQLLLGYIVGASTKMSCMATIPWLLLRWSKVVGSATTWCCCLKSTRSSSSQSARDVHSTCGWMETGSCEGLWFDVDCGLVVVVGASLLNRRLGTRSPWNLRGPGLSSVLLLLLLLLLSIVVVEEVEADVIEWRRAGGESFLGNGFKAEQLQWLSHRESQIIGLVSKLASSQPRIFGVSGVVGWSNEGTECDLFFLRPWFLLLWKNRGVLGGGRVNRRGLALSWMTWTWKKPLPSPSFSSSSCTQLFRRQWSEIKSAKKFSMAFIFSQSNRKWSSYYATFRDSATFRDRRIMFQENRRHCSLFVELLLDQVFASFNNPAALQSEPSCQT